MSIATDSKSKSKQPAPWWGEVKHIARFSQLFNPADYGGAFMVQAVEATSGRLIALKVTKPVYHAIAGKRYGSDKQFKTLGVRKLAHVHFLARMEGDVAKAIDIIPDTYFSRGTAPTSANEARKKGFTVRKREGLEGFEPLMTLTDGRDGEITRHCVCVGMTAGRFREVLDFLHLNTGVKSFDVGNFRGTRQQDGSYVIKAMAAASDEGVDEGVNEAKLR